MAGQNRKTLSFDLIHDSLQGAFEWLGKRAALVLTVIFVALAASGGWAVWANLALSKETELQGKYSVLEKRYLEIKTGFEEAEQEAKVRAADPKKVDPKAPVKARASGDMAKDYGSLPEEFDVLIKGAPTSKAAEMAALNAAELRANYGQKEAALSTLNLVNANHRTSDLVGALVVQTKANLMADAGDCKGAISLWEKITADPKASFLHGESKLRMGLCFEAADDLARAEQLYSEVATAKDNATGEATVKDAERYLRLLRMKKAVRGS